MTPHTSFLSESTSSLSESNFYIRVYYEPVQLEYWHKFLINLINLIMWQRLQLTRHHNPSPNIRILNLDIKFCNFKNLIFKFEQSLKKHLNDFVVKCTLMDATISN